MLCGYSAKYGVKFLKSPTLKNKSVRTQTGFKFVPTLALRSASRPLFSAGVTERMMDACFSIRDYGN